MKAQENLRPAAELRGHEEEAPHWRCKRKLDDPARYETGEWKRVGAGDALR